MYSAAQVVVFERELIGFFLYSNAIVYLSKLEICFYDREMLSCDNAKKLSYFVFKGLIWLYFRWKCNENRKCKSLLKFAGVRKNVYLFG